MLRFKAYLKVLHSRLTLRAPRIPPEVWIENTNCCNAQCVMCPRENLVRPLTFMSLDAFRKIINDIGLYAHKIKRLHVHNFGEPLLDENLFEKIRIAKDRGFPYVYLVTNGSRLTAEKSRKLIESGLDEFKISFYGTDKQTYNVTMKGLDFDVTIQSVRTFFKIRREVNAVKPKVIIQYIPQKENGKRVAEFKLLFKELIDLQIGDTLNVEPLHNYGTGKNFVSIEGKPTTICDYPWKVMLILCDSRVAFCCLDFNGVQIIGDAQEESAIDIWNGKKMSAIRTDFKALDYRKYSVCLQCDRVH